MQKTHIKRIAEELNIEKRQVMATASLIDEGATIPFIARYRKEATDGLDDQPSAPSPNQTFKAPYLPQPAPATSRKPS